MRWLEVRKSDEKEGANGPFVRSRLVAMAHGVRFDTVVGTAPLKCIKIIISRVASIKHTRGEHSRVLAQYDISVAFWHPLLPEDEPIAMYPTRGEEEAGYMWQMKRAMYGTRRASRLFQEHMKGVLKEAGYAKHIVYINGQGFSNGWKIRSILLRSSETVPRWARSHRVLQVARTLENAIQKRWTSWKRWKESCISKIQASVFTCPVEDSTFSSV